MNPRLKLTALGLTAIVLGACGGSSGRPVAPVIPPPPGLLAARTDFASGDSPNSVVIGDVNGDGKPDVVVGNWFSNTVSVFLATGVASLEAETRSKTAARLWHAGGRVHARAEPGESPGRRRPE